MIAYLDSSVLLRWFLGEPDSIDVPSNFKGFYSSILLRIECKRVLHRIFLLEEMEHERYLELNLKLSKFLSRISLVEFSRHILTRAEEPFLFPLGSLDAIHLSSALALRESYKLTLLTHDSQLGRNARALDFDVIGM